jgi:hypothetical protein
MFETIDEEVKKEADAKTTWIKAGIFVVALCVLGACPRINSFDAESIGYRLRAVCKLLILGWGLLFSDTLLGAITYFFAFVGMHE